MITEKIRLLACAMIFASTALATTASAETNGWYVEGQYSTFDIDGLVDVEGVGLVIGNNVADNFAIEFIVGSGVGDDKKDGVTVELDRYYGFVLKPNMDIGEKVNIHVKLGTVYASAEAKAPGFESVRDSDNGFLGGVGAEIDFNDSVYGLIGYSVVKDFDFFNIGIGYRF
jgi:opacity protein-like surface antigen|tara:strand:- start:36 stop:548 length:513 start_codon:yes stop_codon:yes gene_type:complete